MSCILQTALADRLSGLLCDLSPAVAFSYFKGFIETMKREWAGIDQHRMNKYLILVRKFYSACLELFKRSTWYVFYLPLVCLIFQHALPRVCLIYLQGSQVD